MTLPDGWKEGTIKLYTEDEVWTHVTRAITRMMYDCIATHEAHGKTVIEVEWLRDYTDDIAVNFPRIQ
jgi:hypothetical protein